MKPRKFTAKSIPAAIRMIKEELGPDAMILSTKRLPKSPRNPYGKDMFEVMAVSENSPGAFRPPKEAPRTPNRNSPSPAPDLNSHDTDTEPASLFSMPSNPGFNDNGWQTIKSELISIKDMLFIMNMGENQPSIIHTHPEYLNLYTKLIKTGVSERNVQRFIHGASAASLSAAHELKDDSGHDNTLTKKILNQIMASFDVTDPFDIKDEKRAICAFIGPTGVGKTTTIAKLAAELSLKQKKKVGLISIDSYRVGALEQLKTYASIMGLPCLPAFSRKDLQIAVQKLQGCEIILIDTAGHSHLDHQRMKELAHVIKGNLSISCHLVLSATTSRINMKEAADNFAVLNPESYVFTKVDETRIRGAIIDQILDLKLPISYIANGQRVPEDIIPATPKKVLRLILS